MEQVKFDHDQDSFNLSLGITDERRDELTKEMHEITDKAESVVGKVVEKINENTTGIRFDIRDIIEPFMALAKTDAELVYCLFHAGAISSQIKTKIEKNNHQKIRESLSGIFGSHRSSFSDFLAEILTK